MVQEMKIWCYTFLIILTRLFVITRKNDRNPSLLQIYLPLSSTYIVFADLGGMLVKSSPFAASKCVQTANLHLFLWWHNSSIFKLNKLVPLFPGTSEVAGSGIHSWPGVHPCQWRVVPGCHIVGDLHPWRQTLCWRHGGLRGDDQSAARGRTIASAPWSYPGSFCCHAQVLGDPLSILRRGFFSVFPPPPIFNKKILWKYWNNKTGTSQVGAIS